MQVNIDFEFLEKPSKGLKQDDNLWGRGQISGELDKLPESTEEWQAISKVIALNGNYEAVAVTRILPLDDIIRLTDEAIVGEIVGE